MRTIAIIAGLALTYASGATASQQAAPTTPPLAAPQRPAEPATPPVVAPPTPGPDAKSISEKGVSGPPPKQPPPRKPSTGVKF